MRTVLLASLRVHTRRYVAAVVAVVIATSFVVVTDALASAARDGLTADVATPYRGAETVVTGLDGRAATTLHDEAVTAGDPVAVLATTYQPVADGSRRLGSDVGVGAVADQGSLRWQRLTDGRFPRRAGEALVDANAAKSSTVAIGDRLTVGSGRDRLPVRVVGTVASSGGGARSDLYLTWADQRHFSQDLSIDVVAYAQAPAGLADRATELAPGARVRSATAYVAQQQAAVTNGVDVLALVLLVFAAIAVFTAVLVIANTFSILFAQRQRDLALLRCVGATRRQVLGSVRAEALVLGGLSSLAGLGVGTGLGLGLVAAIRHWFPKASLGHASLSPAWLVGAFVLGVVVTLVAAWLPSRRAVRVSPLAALRPETAGDTGAATSRLRWWTGLAVTALGGAGLALAVVASSAPVMLLGGAATFTGVLLLGPVLVPALIRLVGVVTGRFAGPTGRLAVGNAVRNPRRTAATAASLLVGVTLTTAVLTGMASSRSAVDQQMDGQHPLDATLTAPARGTTLPDGLLSRVRATPGVARAVPVDGITARVSGVGAMTVLAAPGDAGVVRGHGLAMPSPGVVRLPYDAVDGDLPDRVRITVAGTTRTLRVVAGEGWGGVALVSPATLRSLGGTPSPRAVWARGDGSVGAADLGGDLDALAAPYRLEVAGGLASREYVDLQLDVLTGAVVGLLGIAVVIALIGIANTLGLSVLERGRENALLRALGLTRRQLRATLALEAVLLSGVAAVIGTALGVLFAWVGIEAMVRQVVATAPVVLPWGQLAAVLAVSGLAGVASCVLPARRAARTAPAAGLALD